MKRFFQKPYAWALVYSLLLLSASLYVLLDTFVIPKTYLSVAASMPAAESPPPRAPVITATSYEDDAITVRVETVREFETTVHIAEITLKESGLFRTALANNRFGRNISATTSAIAGERNAIFAVNGDYYGFRDEGYVLRDGVLYRDGGNREALVMTRLGDFLPIPEEEITADILKDAWQIWSFGPVLVRNGSVSVEENSEISGRFSTSNPRTAIGQIAPLRYLAIVSEGRTADNRGLSLHELARLFSARGCVTAYNLDGGGSATMYLNGSVINRPTTNGRRIAEREVSDIVYIGYE